MAGREPFGATSAGRRFPIVSYCFGLECVSRSATNKSAFNVLVFRLIEFLTTSDNCH